MKRSILVLVSLAFLGGSMVAQEKVPKSWHLKDRQTDGYYGISLDKAYEFVKSKNRKGKTVIVAVIDSGVDTTHEDLKPILWVNKKEKPGNGIDDDKNGYVDDIYGWNFIGGRDGRNVEKDTYEVARVYYKYKEKFGNVTDPSTLSKEDQELYKMWKRAERETGASSGGASPDLEQLVDFYKSTLQSDSILRLAMNKEKYTGKELDEFVPKGDTQTMAKGMVLRLFKANEAMEATNQEFIIEGFGGYVRSEQEKVENAGKAPVNYRGDVVKDNYYDFNDRFYGNNDVMAGSSMHGTHVSGIIAAVRGNGKGSDGIADNVRIMTVRAVPDGDEHDKDIALAIRYAVDNGAQIINMSFGKGYSPEKTWVDEAVKYAESKGVLLVHAAGNSGANIDTTENYPTAVFTKDKYRAPNWITVGASGDPKAGGLTAGFSNYGKTEVDVFAPGVLIYSTLPGGNKYGNLQGTSMASPVVAGMAAFILSYYPDLTAEQLKSVIEKSTVKPTDKVKVPGTGETSTFGEISKSGGLVNAYEAIKLASTMKGERKMQPVKTKSTVKQKKG